MSNPLTKNKAPLAPTPEKATAGLFKFLKVRRDDYADMSFSPEEAHSMRMYLTHLSTGATAAIPLICGGAAHCPFASQCPLVRIDIERKKKDPKAKSVVPVTKQCLVELELLDKWTDFYIAEYEVQETNWTDFQTVRQLAEIELMLWRLNNNLAKPENAQLVGEVPVFADKEGTVHYKGEALALLTTKETLLNRKAKLIKVMVGDRQEKYKREAALKIKSETDASTSAAKLRQQMDQLMRQTQTLNLRLKEAEGTVINGTVVYPEGAEKPLTPEDLIGGSD